MRDVLAPSNVGVLAHVAWSNALVAFDYDGTLAPIVVDPAKARMRRRTRVLLAAVSRLYPCVVISGRAQEDALRLLRGIGVFEVMGNHGLEPWRRTELFAARVGAWLPDLRRDLESLPGVTIEDKSFSLAIHYRRSPRRKRARARIMAAVSGLRGARVIAGKCAVNLVPEGAPHKGVALEGALSRLGCDTALYVGDDNTDEDVFGLEDPRVVAVRVGATTRTRAELYVRDQRAIDSLLVRLAELRRSAQVRKADPGSGTHRPSGGTPPRRPSR